MDVYNSKAAALIRTQAIRSGQLTPLFGGLETQLGDSAGCAEPVDESLLTKAKAGREATEKFMAGLDPTATQFENMFHERFAHWLGLDKHIKLEKAFFAASTGDAGIARVRAFILMLLPPAQGVVTTKAACLQCFNSHMQDALLSYAGVGAKSAFDDVHAYVRSIADGAAPVFAASHTGEFYESVKTRPLRFCTHDQKRGVKTKRQLEGSDAVVAMFGAADKKKAAKQKLELADVQPLVVFGWVLPGAQSAEVKIWRDKAVEEGVQIVLSAPGAASSAAGEDVESQGAG